MCSQGKTPSLKRLAKEHLDKDIQKGEHTPVRGEGGRDGGNKGGGGREERRGREGGGREGGRELACRQGILCCVCTNA